MEKAASAETGRGLPEDGGQTAAAACGSGASTTRNHGEEVSGSGDLGREFHAGRRETTTVSLAGQFKKY
jgi:hypothetical protein